MSHIAKVNCIINNLDALSDACDTLGAELMRDQTTFKSYPGTPNKCQHAIRLKGQANAYEVGLRKLPQGEDAYDLACDFYDGKLIKAFGSNLVGLRNEYLASVSMQQLRQRGWRVQREEVAPNQIRVNATR